MVEGIDFSAASLLGGRETQQDEWGAHSAPPSLEGNARLLAIVADGMGGMPGGEDASQVAVQAFLEAYSVLPEPAPNRLRHALLRANQRVASAVDERPELDGMGCTFLAALFFAGRMVWLSVGDSLLILHRQGRMQRINPLHIYATKLDEMARRGEISADEAREHPDRMALTSAIQGGALREIDEGELALEPDDVILLASDGILTLSSTELTGICSQHANDVNGIVRTIVERIESYQRPHQDNATVVAVRNPLDPASAACTCNEVSTMLVRGTPT